MTFKKLFLAVFSVLLLIGIAGCVGKKDLASTVSQQAYNYVWTDEKGHKTKGALYFGVADKNQGYYIKYSDTLNHRDPNFDSDVKDEKHTYSISKDGKIISLSDDGDGNGSGIGSNVAAVMLKDVSVKGDKITARVYYYKDDEGEITLTPVKE
mgnify:CR=1 FL=1